ncbi:hypothetical protein INR49_031212 [Caranx melampygus]|nr:hypothetical protein INR49_031212 [Caranx melampygus]
MAETSSALDSGEGSEGTAEKCKKEAKPNPRQYMKTIIIWIHITPADPPQPQGFFCGEVLANSAMKPAHYSEHQSTKHSGLSVSEVGARKKVFERRVSSITKDSQSHTNNLPNAGTGSGEKN